MDLHAKVIATEHVAFIGSANLNATGIDAGVLLRDQSLATTIPDIFETLLGTLRNPLQAEVLVWYERVTAMGKPLREFLWLERPREVEPGDDLLTPPYTKREFTTIQETLSELLNWLAERMDTRTNSVISDAARIAVTEAERVMETSTNLRAHLDFCIDDRLWDRYTDNPNASYDTGDADALGPHYPEVFEERFDAANDAEEDYRALNRAHNGLRAALRLLEGALG